MDAKKINRGLRAPIAMTLFDEIDSTNTRAKAMVAEGLPEGPHLLAAQSQTAGRGRHGRSFLSPEGGLYLSLILPAAVPASAWRLVTPAAAVAVRRAILEVCGVACGIKWVNDLEVEGKKVCGILAELSGGRTVVGVGINLWWAAPPAEIAQTAAALLQGPRPGVREALAAAVVNHLLALTASLPDAGFLEEYRACSTLLGRTVTVHTPALCWTGHAVGIDAQARLLVAGEDGQTVALEAGEVTVRRTETPTES